MMSFDPSIGSRYEEMSDTEKDGLGRTNHSRTDSRGRFSYGCCIHGLWRDTQPRRYRRWEGWLVPCSRLVEMEGPIRKYKNSRVSSRLEVIYGSTGRFIARKRQEGDFVARRQSGSFTGSERLCFVNKIDDEGASCAETLFLACWYSHTRRMDSVCGQQIWGRIVATVPTRILLGQVEVSAFRSGCYGCSGGRFPSPPIIIASVVPSPSSMGGTGEVVGPRGGPPAVPTIGPHRPDFY